MNDDRANTFDRKIKWCKFMNVHFYEVSIVDFVRIIKEWSWIFFDILCMWMLDKEWTYIFLYHLVFFFTFSLQVKINWNREYGMNWNHGFNWSQTKILFSFRSIRFISFSFSFFIYHIAFFYTYICTLFDIIHTKYF